MRGAVDHPFYGDVMEEYDLGVYQEQNDEAPALGYPIWTCHIPQKHGVFGMVRASPTPDFSYGKWRHFFGHCR